MGLFNNQTRSSSLVMALVLMLAGRATPAGAVSLNAMAGPRAGPSLWSVDRPDLQPVDTATVRMGAGIANGTLRCNRTVQNQLRKATLVVTQESTVIAAAWGLVDGLELDVTVPVRRL